MEPWRIQHPCFLLWAHGWPAQGALLKDGSTELYVVLNLHESLAYQSMGWKGWSMISFSTPPSWIIVKDTPQHLQGHKAIRPTMQATLVFLEHVPAMCTGDKTSKHRGGRWTSESGVQEWQSTWTGLASFSIQNRNVLIAICTVSIGTCVLTKHFAQPSSGTLRC